MSVARAAASWPELRLLSSRHLEQWLSSPVSARACKPLLMRVCELTAAAALTSSSSSSSASAAAGTQFDLQTVQVLLAMRVRPVSAAV
jgi:hypothetical protein